MSQPAFELAGELPQAFLGRNSRRAGGTAANIKRCRQALGLGSVVSPATSRIVQHRPAPSAPFPRPPRFLCDPHGHPSPFAQLCGELFPTNCTKPPFKVITFLLFPLKKKKTYGKKKQA